MIETLHKSVEELYRTEIDFIDGNNKGCCNVNIREKMRKRDAIHKYQGTGRL